MDLLIGLMRRLTADYVWRSRLQDYEKTLRGLRNCGFIFLTVSDFARRLRSGETLPSRFCILRNDIDSDPNTAVAMFRIDKSLGIVGTYYFSLRTLRPTFAKQLRENGSEVGYHFEELATFAYRHNISEKTEILSHIDTIRDDFRRNLNHFKEMMNFMPSSVASHGDFMNRVLHQTNSIIVDEAIKAEFGLVCEAYDDDLMAAFDAVIIDDPVQGWRPETPEQAVIRGAQSLRVLVHPRSWRSNVLWNAHLDIVRTWKALSLRARSLRRSLRIRMQ
jgi:hypothetical protein